MFIDKGVNDLWVKPKAVRKLGKSHYSITIREPLNRFWEKEIVKYPIKGNTTQVTCNDKNATFQMSGEGLGILVENLQPGETREYQVKCSSGKVKSKSGNFLKLTRKGNTVIADNGAIALRLPATKKLSGKKISGPIQAIRNYEGKWIGSSRLEVTETPTEVTTKLVEDGPLWATVEVKYKFPDKHNYQMQIKFFPKADYSEICETSILPVKLVPMPRPYREISTLGKSHWDRGFEDIAEPCIRPFPADNFIFELDPDFNPDRLVTHSTASWEIMDLPLKADHLKAYTAMRGAFPAIDGGWLGVYSSKKDSLIGMASIDLAHWRVPDETIHPIHRTPGSNAEVVLLDSATDGTKLRFPISNINRHWLLGAFSRNQHGLKTKVKKNKPSALDPDPQHPLWAMRNRLGDYRLDKVKDWVTEWEDDNDPHPRVFCKETDFPAIRKKVKNVPEVKECYEKTKHLRSSDRYIVTGKGGGLAEIEKATHAIEFIHDVLDKGYIGPKYAIGLARNMRRFTIACDIEWNSFSPEEKREVRRICALGAYIMSDGDWWQYALRPGETTYLPNFNTDVFTAYGLIGMFLSDHPCSDVWINNMVKRLELDFEYHLREDGCGEENLGAYNISTWMQLWFPAIWALRHCQVKDYSNDPRIHAGAQFFLDILGPPDPRDNWFRSVPPIGHHPSARKDVRICACLASFIKDADPALAANLMWAWRETGALVRNNYDHSGPTANPATRMFIFLDPTIKAKSCLRKSKLLPNDGAVCHSHTDTRSGSFLLHKAGRIHSHHDPDEGSFHYFARGVPLAVDGLPMVNVPYQDSAALHNVVSFDKDGQPTGEITKFVSTPECDYLQTKIRPRNFACDAMYHDFSHHSGFERELILVKNQVPGAIEYLIVKDTTTGPDSCQWNLDVLSRKPKVTRNRVCFPGHNEKGFKMGLEVTLLEPSSPQINIVKGLLGDEYQTSKRKGFKENHLSWRVVEHWLMQVPATPGTTFLAVLFPKRPNEKSPKIEYYSREEVIRINHDEGEDLVFMRSYNPVPVIIDNIKFKGRTGIAHTRRGKTSLHALDAVSIVNNQENQGMIKI